MIIGIMITTIARMTFIVMKITIAMITKIIMLKLLVMIRDNNNKNNEDDFNGWVHITNKDNSTTNTNNNDNDNNTNPRTNEQRKKNIVWFNKPFNKNEATNVRNYFLNLIDEHFTETTNSTKFSTETI